MVSIYPFSWIIREDIVGIINAIVIGVGVARIANAILIIIKLIWIIDQGAIINRIIDQIIVVVFYRITGITASIKISINLIGVSY